MTGTRLLAGRRALVTGAVGAIGEAIARRFAEEGAELALLDLDEEATAALATRIAREHGVRAIGLGGDVVAPASMEAAADRVAAELGVADVVVVNAGVLAIRPVLELTLEEWDRVISVNLRGAFVTGTAFARRLVASGAPGSLIFTSSLFGVRGGPGNAAYSASKFGVLGLSQSMAADLASSGIRVNAVCPGQIESRMLDTLFERRAEESGRSAAEERAEFEARIPLGRLGQTREIADAFVYLASPLSRYTTGQHLVVDGGWQVA